MSSLQEAKERWSQNHKTSIPDIPRNETTSIPDILRPQEEKETGLGMRLPAFLTFLATCSHRRVPRSWGGVGVPNDYVGSK